MEENPRRLLIAERGVAAAQLVYASWAAGWEPVAVYADQDFDSLYVRQAALAVALQGSTLAESYENPTALVQTAVKFGCYAIHPGFGSLRSNTDLVRLATAAGIKVLWQLPEAAFKAPIIREKTVSVKAAANTLSAQELATAPAAVSTKSTAQQLVKTAVNTRKITVVAHILDGDIKVLGEIDNIVMVHGHTLFAESPAQLATDVRQALLQQTLKYCAAFAAASIKVKDTAAAINEVAAKGAKDIASAVVSASGICGAERAAGFVTLEFELLQHTIGAGSAQLTLCRAFAGLPAEHRVLSAALGIDLLQLSLQFSVQTSQQAGVALVNSRQQRHAVSCAVLAADTSLGFVPQAGILSAVIPPAGTGLIWDPGYSSADQVPAEFESLLANLTVSAANRVAAWQKLYAALRGAIISGVPTTIAVCIEIIESAVMQQGLPRGAVFDGEHLLQQMVQLAATKSPKRPLPVTERVVRRQTLQIGDTKIAIGLADALSPGAVAAIGAVLAQDMEFR